MISWLKVEIVYPVTSKSGGKAYMFVVSKMMRLYAETVQNL